MNIGNFENFLGNSAFVFLFLSMIFYWIQLTFSFQKWNFGKIFMIGGNLSLFTFLLLRWIESGHFPLSNLYESLIFLSWSLSTFHLLLEINQFHPKTFFNLSENKGFSSTFFSTVPSVQSSSGLSSPEERRETKEFGENQQTNQKGESFFSAFTSPAPLFINAFATFTLPKEMQHSSPLVPALQSNWLMMHVTVMILSYAALICGCLLSIAFLIVTANVQKDSSEATAPSLKQGFGDILDNLSYRMVGLGFPFLTIGILSGAVWANEAWGSYWSWDPKETWALATWLIFAIYLHTRLTKGWRGKKPAFIATFGFFVVWICFLGVNLLGEGLHSYGFFQK